MCAKYCTCWQKLQICVRGEKEWNELEKKSSEWWGKSVERKRLKTEF